MKGGKGGGKRTLPNIIRIVKMRYDVTEATTTELLEAQTVQLKAANDLVIGEVNVDAALYTLAVARGTDLCPTRSR